ncbi:MAG: hypothetical protein QX199_03035 [Methylococcaceae bacterium]
MADNIIPGHLKVVRVEMNGVCNEVDDLKLRIGSIEEHIAGVRYDQLILQSGMRYMHRPVTMDNFALLFNHIKLCERN